jgi:hypothetical protein
VSGVGFFTDAYDLFVIGIVSALLKGQWHLGTGQLALLNAVMLGATIAIQLAIFAVAAVPGYILAIAKVDRIGHRRLQLIGFVLMGLCFAVIGLVPGMTTTVAPFLVVYGVSYFFTEFGPNVTTFVLPEPAGRSLEEISGERRRGLHHVTEQQRRGDRADTAGNGRESVGDTGHRRIDVAGQAAVRRRVGPHVDDRGAGGDVTGADESGPAGRGDEDVGLAGERREVSGPRVADRHGGVPVKQQMRGGFPDHDGPADHHRMPAAQFHPVVVKQPEHRLGRGRGERGQPRRQAAEGLRAGAVHVLGRRDRGRQAS